MKNVKGSIEVLSLFNGGDVGGLLDDADQALVAGGTSAVGARVDVGDVVAHRAEAQIRFDVAYGLREAFGVFIAGAEDVEGKTLRALGSNARQLLQLVDEARHGFGETRHFKFCNLVIG